MNPVTVKKDDLLATLKENRDAHRDTYEVAVPIYREKAAALAKEQAELMLRGEIRAIVVSLPVPEDHTEDYDRVISMLEWSVDDTYELNEPDFNCYVLDQWGWGRSFAANTSSYLAH